MVLNPEKSVPGPSNTRPLIDAIMATRGDSLVLGDTWNKQRAGLRHGPAVNATESLLGA
jgi:hypothetical protein